MNSVCETNATNLPVYVTLKFFLSVLFLYLPFHFLIPLDLSVTRRYKFIIKNSQIG